MFRGYLELCAHTNSFVFPLVCNYTYDWEKRVRWLVNSVLGKFLYCLYITRVCIYLYSYTKVHVKMFKLKYI